MRTFTIVALAFLFVFVGIQRVAQADEIKAAVEHMKGKTKAAGERIKGEAKELKAKTE